MKILFFDSETTGTDPKANGIHQLSGQVVIDGQVKESFDIKMHPIMGDLIEDKALEVSGVTREDLAGYPAAIDGFCQFKGILSRYVRKFDKTDKFFLAGFNNAHFDNQFLREWFIKHGDMYFGSYFWSNSIDVMVLATQYLLKHRHRMVNFKLMTVAEALGIKIDHSKLHDAMYDIYLTQLVYNIVTKAA